MERGVYFLVFGLLRIVQFLPAIVCHYLGIFFGWIAWALLPGYREIVRKNLEVAFDREWSKKQIRRAVRAHFARLGSNLLGAAHFFAASEKEVRAHTRMLELETLRAAHRKGKGVILAISHIGNWELFAQACFYAKELPFGTVFQKVHNRFIDAAITKYRERLGVRAFDRKTGLNAATAFLRSGGVLGILVDQHAGDSGIWTPLFSKLASTSPLAASLALKTGAAIVPVAIHQTGAAKWDILVSPEIPTEDKSVSALTHDINCVLEKQIRHSPLDWFWVHERWKLPNPEFLLGNSKRGVFLPENVSAASLRPLRIVVRTSNWLGDAVMNVPAVRAIKAGRPDAKLTVMTPAKLAAVWKQIPEVDEVLELPNRPSLLKTASLLKGKYDVGIVFPNSLRTALELFVAGIPRRVGMRGHRRAWLLNQIVKPRKAAQALDHQTEHYLHIAKKIGASKPAAPRLHPPANRRSQLETLSLGVCPGAEYGPAKRWPAARFREVMEAISQRRDCVWTVFGVAKDRPIAEEICQGFRGKIRNLTGETSLEELIDELKTVRILLTNDTGTMHLAGMLGVPIVAIFGSTEPILTGPPAIAPQKILRKQVECSPCFQRECPIDFRCMNEIRVEETTEAILSLLERAAEPVS